MRNRELSTDPNVFSKQLNEKFRLLEDFGIKTNTIPTGYFNGLRSQRDLDLRAEELIAKKLLMVSYQ